MSGIFEQPKLLLRSLARQRKFLAKIFFGTVCSIALLHFLHSLTTNPDNGLRKITSPNHKSQLEQYILYGAAYASTKLGSDTRLLASKIKHHQRMFDALYVKDHKLDAEIRDRLLISLTTMEAMYPINKLKYASIWDLYSSFQGRGIVMTTGKFHFKYALHAINVIRRINCTLPIEVFYNGPDDLSESMIRTLRLTKNTKAINARDLVSPLIDNSIGGWAIKPFAMLMSSFQEFVFLDADVLFFQNPENLFDFKSYIETGTLYFRDRTIGAGDDSTLRYFEKMVKNPSKYAKTQRILKRLTVHEAESGVIVMDKKRGGLFVLLLATMLNMEPFQQDMYKVIHGDKESYWMASEALGVPYRWAPGAGGTVGYMNPNVTDSICGQLYHVDENWMPLWFNGGVVMNKHTDIGRSKIMPITHFAIDSSYKNIEWEWETDAHPFCLKPADPKKEIGVLSKEYWSVGQMMIYEWLSLNLPPID